MHNPRKKSYPLLAQWVWPVVPAVDARRCDAWGRVETGEEGWGRGGASAPTPTSSVEGWRAWGPSAACLMRHGGHLLAELRN